MNKKKLLIYVMKELSGAGALNGCIDGYFDKIEAEANRVVGFWIENNGKNPDIGRLAIIELGYNGERSFEVAESTVRLVEAVVNLEPTLFWWKSISGQHHRHDAVKRYAYLEGVGE